MTETPKWQQPIVPETMGNQEVETIFKDGKPIGVSVTGGAGPVAAGSHDYGDGSTSIDYHHDEPVVIIKPIVPPVENK